MLAILKVHLRSPVSSKPSWLLSIRPFPLTFILKNQTRKVNSCANPVYPIAVTDSCNPVPFKEAKLQVPVEATPWPKDRIERASVNSFGIGGTNAHVCLIFFNSVAEC